MKKLFAIILTTLLCIGMEAENRGVPFIRNFNAAEYHAHNRNYDIAIDDYGTVYVANFEGLLYYDGCSWRKIHTPGISRVTRIAKGKNGLIWVGGHKVFGYLEADDQGRLKIHAIVSDAETSSLDEVDMIKVTKNRVYVHTMNGRAFYVKDMKKLVPLSTMPADQVLKSASDSIFNLRLQDFTVSMLKSGGLVVNYDKFQRKIMQEDGLCSNNISFITHDGKNTLWGATEHGVFAMDMPSLYSHVSEGQGLHGDVYSLGQLGSTLYVGTLHGLYTLKDGKPERIININLACWQITPYGENALLAATTEGLWLVTQDGCQRITSNSTLAVVPDGKGGFYTGEMDGIYKVTSGGQRTMMGKIEKAISMKIAKNQLRLETIYGEIWTIALDGSRKVNCIRPKEDPMEPKIEITDMMGRRWYTDNEGKNLTLDKKAKNYSELARWVAPMRGYLLNTVFCNKENSLWIGGDFGVINCDLSIINRFSDTKRKKPLYIREITTINDSVLWGGYNKEGLAPVSEITDLALPSSMRMITVAYSTDEENIFSPYKYRYRINNGRWTNWSENNITQFTNIEYGYTEMEIQAMDIHGNLSETARVRIHIGFPVFLQWWALIIYIIILLIIIRLAVKQREKKLLKDKEELEKVVTARTSELRERTAELSTALDDLQKTQADLVRMERTATAGKLTQGLIDRILNPINYINNFSKLTAGLAKDLSEDIEDEQENMSEDNYEDCIDILDMMKQNLGKIEEHGEIGRAHV